MSVRPEIAIKAGKCNFDDGTVIPLADPGVLYIYLNPEDELHHLCWKKRSDAEPADEDNLLIIPGDARFVPYKAAESGRIYVLKFSSSSDRRFFWLQSAVQDESKGAGYWSERDLSYGKRIDRILQGLEEEDAEDEEMGDAPIDSTEIETEGEPARRGGEDGGRADSQAQSQQSMAGLDLAALIRGITVPGQGQSQRQQYQQSALSLHDLLPSSNTIPALANASPAVIDELAANLPSGIIPADATADQKKAIIIKVLQSPQFAQSLVSLSGAIKEGGIGGIAESLRVPIDFNAAAQGQDLVEVFVNGVKKEVKKEEENK